MRKLIIISLLTSINFLSAQNFDTQSATKFWELVDYVKKDNQITDVLWKDFRNQKADSLWFGMAKQMDKNYEQFYRNAVEIVFRKSNKTKLDSILNIPKDSPRNLQNIFVKGLYRNYFLEEKGMRIFYKKILEKGYVDKIYKIASTMLPKKYKKPQNELDKLNIYVHCIESSANSTKQGIIFSVAGLYDFEKHYFGVLGAHELHHKLRKSNLKETITKNHEYAVQIMDDCLNEGSADILNNYPVFALGELKELKESILKESEQKLKTIDNWFLESSKDNSKTKSQDEINSLFDYLGGHNPGYFMASVIVKNGFKNELKETVDNPFNFFLLYQKASKLDKLKPINFSIESIQFITELEKLYYLKNRN